MGSVGIEVREDRLNKSVHLHCCLLPSTQLGTKGGGHGWRRGVEG
jgi:hypothetical protein